MKGIVLAGGSGTRQIPVLKVVGLNPTRVTSLFLLPVICPSSVISVKWFNENK